MTPCYLRGCRKLLELIVIMMVLISTSSLKQCGPKTIVTFRNVGVKLCELKCAEHGQCLSFQYDIETLTCRLSRQDSKRIKKNDGYSSVSKNSLDLFRGSCASKTCIVGQRCLKTRSGNAVCVQDGKQTYAERTPQHDEDKQKSFANSRLHEACQKGNLTRVRNILTRGLVNINGRDRKNGRTPLMMAAKKGHSQIVDLLLRKGANVSHVDNNGDNTLHWACSGGHVDIVRDVLSQHSVDINSRSKSGKVPLMTTVYHGHREVFDYLAGMGANVSQVDDDGDNVLHWACRGGHLGMVKHLLSNCSVDINSRGYLGRTPLMTAAYHGHGKVFDGLVFMGANMSQVDDNGDNILHSACRGGHVDMVRYVLTNCSVDVNSRSNSGKLPIMSSAYYGHRKVFDVLVGMGANVSHVDNNGYNVLHWACMGEYVGMVKYLLSNYSVHMNSKGMFGRTLLMTTVYKGSIDLFKYFVSLGANVSDVDDHGDNILHRASVGGHAKMVQYIISQDIVDINSRGRYGRTPLMRAAYFGRKEAFDVLVRSGCRTDLVDDEGHTILHLASLGGCVEMVKYILSQNMADINATDKDGDTAAMIAKRNGQHACYHCLVSRHC